MEMTAKMTEKPEKVDNQKVSSFGLHRLFGAVDISPDTCIVPEEKLRAPPSLVDGVEKELEGALRLFGCELIQAASILLKLPQVAAATGQILYQRYFYSKSFVRNNFEHVAMACLHLASKIEEAPRRPRDVINVFHHLKQMSKIRSSKDKNRKPAPMILDASYIALKNHVIKAERRVLNVLGFCVHVKHPHKIITYVTRSLGRESDTNLYQRTWNYMNDSLRTDIFVRYTPETITCACVFLAARDLKVPLPMEPVPWWQLFEATEEQVFDIAQTLVALYQRVKPLSWSRLDRQITELRAKLQQKAHGADVKEETATAENTPKKNEKFSPTSRNVSPTQTKGDRRNRDVQNGDAPDRHRRRSRSRSSSAEAGATPSPRHKDSVPKRYSNHKGWRERHRDRRPHKQRTARSRSTDRIVKDSSKKRRRSRSQTDKRGRYKARKEREREVIQALGKRRRGSSSPEVLVERKSANKGQHW